MFANAVGMSKKSLKRLLYLTAYLIFNLSNSSSNCFIFSSYSFVSLGCSIYSFSSYAPDSYFFCKFNNFAFLIIISYIAWYISCKSVECIKICATTSTIQANSLHHAKRSYFSIDHDLTNPIFVKYKGWSSKKYKAPPISAIVARIRFFTGLIAFSLILLIIPRIIGIIKPKRITFLVSPMFAFKNPSLITSLS